MEDISAFQMDLEHKKFTIDDVSSGLRRLIFQKCKQVRPVGIFINEYLTKHRHDVMYGIRQLKNTYPQLKKVFSDYGRLFIVVEGSQRPISVLTVDDAKEACGPPAPPTARPTVPAQIAPSIPANVGPTVSAEAGLPPANR